ncbi:MAG: squalene--hopene cyclase [Burkholderiaceae bacterium]|nr:squalene--hopene cyclase [Burkholderiaceae bacterium]
MPHGSLVVITGLAAEARVAEGPGICAIATGADPLRLERELERALRDGARAVLSFGIAAGLEGGHETGTIVIPDEVIAGSDRYATDPHWSERMRVALTVADARPLAGVDAPLLHPADKVRLHESTGAVAADMESHHAARITLRTGRPFAALRVIADPAQRTIPTAAAVGMRPDGGVNLIAVLSSLLRDPSQLPALARVAFDARVAIQTLARCRRELGTAFEGH